MSSIETRHLGIPLLILALLLQGCGFHLRGSVALPSVMQSVHLAGTATTSTLAQSITALLRANGARLVSSTTEATARLEILGEKQDRRILALSAAGSVSEYELNYQVSFRLSDAKAKELMGEQSIGLTMNYRFDPNNALAMADEESKLQNEMVRRAAEQILRRIQARVK